jgi:hypothetical protein
MSSVINLSGTWHMSGHQSNVPNSYWEAELILRTNGSLFWKETKGANVGATREGNWNYDDKEFTMHYTAPNSGLVEWESNQVSQSRMEGSYRTPHAGPQPIGWGGSWSANKNV